MKLYDFQRDVLVASKQLNRVAYYYDMGLGKTFIGSAKMKMLNAPVNLVVCQKSKIDDWKKHFIEYYPCDYSICDLTDKKQFESFFDNPGRLKVLGIINYELLFRRPELAGLQGFTLMLDESSLIQNETSKRSKFILNNLKPANVILLSGTPTGGKYENLWSQLKLLGWNISKSKYWDEFVNYYVDDRLGFPMKIVKGYKQVNLLKNKMKEYGCFFKKTDEVFDLPKQQFINVNVEPSKEYKTFQKTNVVMVKDYELLGDSALNQLLYERQLCGMFSTEKMNALKDLLSSSDDRFIIFYNFNHELEKIMAVCGDKPISIVNGNVKDLTKYENEDNSVTLIQYQAGAMGLNLQLANKIIYFTPPLSSELFEQSKKRTHRIGQKKPCFYYQLICKDSVEEKIYFNLAKKQDYTEKLFKGGL
jgi:SNF2 family DNA or RNA helicase